MFPTDDTRQSPITKSGLFVPMVMVLGTEVDQATKFLAMGKSFITVFAHESLQNYSLLSPAAAEGNLVRDKLDIS